MADGTARSSGGGNSLKPSHNHGLWQVGIFNNLALWGEKKFVSEQERTYKFQRGVNNILDCHANQTRILSKEYSFVAGNYVRSTARNDVNCHTEDKSPKYRMVSKIYQCLTNVDKRLRNKCAMTWNSDMKENNFTDKVFSRFTSHLSLKSAFTLAEVLITLGIIGVVAAMTIPTLIGNYKFSVLNNQLKTVYSDLNQAATLFKVHNEISVSEYAASTSATSALDLFSKEYTTVLNRNNMNAGTKDENGYRLEPYETHSITGKGSGALFCDASYYMYDPQGRIISFDNEPSGYENGPKVCIDVNGLKKPNRIGQDIFIFVFTVDGHVIPFGQQHANNSAVGWIYGNGSIENKEDYCVYSSNSSKQMACANYALINQHPHTAGKDYWHDFVNGK